MPRSPVAALLLAATACTPATSPPKERPSIPLTPRSDEASDDTEESPEPVFEGFLVDGSCFGPLNVSKISVTSFPPEAADTTGRCSHDSVDGRTTKWPCVRDDGTRIQQTLIKKGGSGGGLPNSSSCLDDHPGRERRNLLASTKASLSPP